jgi:hypothetical protein
MTLQQFKYLSLKEQEFVLKTQAVFIASMQDQENTYNLFQVDSFYLEVHCNGEETIVSSLSYFEEINLLEPYLKLINIDPIYQLLGYGRMH